MGEKIRVLLKRKKMTIAELAKAIEISSQNLSNKLSRDNFQSRSFTKLPVPWVALEGFFIFEDNERI